MLVAVNMRLHAVVITKTNVFYQYNVKLRFGMSGALHLYVLNHIATYAHIFSFLLTIKVGLLLPPLPCTHNILYLDTINTICYEQLETGPSTTHTAIF